MNKRSKKDEDVKDESSKFKRVFTWLDEMTDRLIFNRIALFFTNLYTILLNTGIGRYLIQFIEWFFVASDFWQDLCQYWSAIVAWLNTTIFKNVIRFYKWLYQFSWQYLKLIVSLVFMIMTINVPRNYLHSLGFTTIETYLKYCEDAMVALAAVSLLPIVAPIALPFVLYKQRLLFLDLFHTFKNSLINVSTVLSNSIVEILTEIVMCCRDLVLTFLNLCVVSLVSLWKFIIKSGELLLAVGALCIGAISSVFGGIIAALLRVFTSIINLPLQLLK